ncbi:MAG: hypothetical protein LUE86_06920 [Clostridiales bacterium]|nr:hypothetical protein [Clostridiales bacterium]
MRFHIIAGVVLGSTFVCMVLFVIRTAQNYNAGRISEDSMLSRICSSIIMAIIIFPIIGRICFLPSPVSEEEYNYFSEHKMYIVSVKPESVEEAVAIGAEMNELNTWLQNAQASIKLPACVYIGLPEGLIEETPIVFE